MEDGAHVFRQARTAKGEPGLKVTARDVELGIAEEHAHYGLGVHIRQLTKRGDFVCEAHLQGMKSVAGVFTISAPLGCSTKIGADCSP